MAATNNVPSSNDGMIGVGVKVDTVNWNAKGHKIIRGSVMDLTVDPTLNIRFRAGSELYGTKLEKDSYDVPGMRQQINDRLGIQEPIIVSARKDGKKIVLRGNRRAVTGQEMVGDPNTTDEIRRLLTESTPMILLTGLTPEQEREMVMDQDQKQFLRSEVVRYIFSLRRAQWSYERISLLLWETLGRFTGNAKKLAEVREITDPALKREKIKTWLRGSLDNYLIWGYDLGQWVQKQILLSEMRVDGLLAPNQERAYFDTTKDSQKRIAALRKAKDADGAKWNGMILIEGSEFKKVADEFRKQDTDPTGGNGRTASGPKMMDKKDIEGMKDAFTSKVARSLIRRILGEQVDDLDVVDQNAGVFETKVQLLEGALPSLRPEIAAIVRVCLTNPDPTDFQRFLRENEIVVPLFNPDVTVKDESEILKDDGNTNEPETFTLPE